MQTADTEGNGMLFEALMIMRKAEACRSSGGRGSWTGKSKVQVVCRGRLTKATNNVGLETGECHVVVGCRGRQKKEKACRSQ